MIKSENSFLPNKTELHDLEILYGKENYDLLETKTKFLIEKYPNVSMLYNILGVSRSSKKMFKEAIPNFEKAIQLNPKLLDAYSNLGIALKNLGALQKSLIFLICYYTTKFLLGKFSLVMFFKRTI